MFLLKTSLFLKRRCLYQWIDYPSFETEYQIVQMKVPGISERLTCQVVSAVQKLRQAELFKPPGIAEALDWGRAVLAMDRNELDEQIIDSTLGVLLKYQDDVQRVKELYVDQLTNESSTS